MSLQEEELVSSHAGQPEQASSLLDQIMAQTRIQPGSEGYDVARQGVTAFIASILQSTASAERSDLERELNTWIRQYVADQENPPADVRSRKPLRAAKVEVMDVEGEPGWYQVALSVRPHFKFMGANFELSLVGRLDRE